MDVVTLDVSDSLATVTLNRPAQHNALDLAMLDGLHAAIATIGADRSVRAVIIQGEGPSFCSGLDTSIFADGASAFARLGQRVGEHDGNYFQHAATGWSELAVPVVAALHGNVFGGGLQLALGADIRVCAPTASLSVLETRWGLIPDMGITQALPRLMPIDRAKDLVFTGRRVGGTEALEYHLVSELADDPRARALAIAREWTTHSPDALAAAKRLIDESWTIQRRDALALEQSIQETLIGGANQVESVTAFFEKRPPRFS